MSAMTPEEMRAAAEAGTPLPAPAARELIYEMEPVACTLTLDRKQAWILSVILHPYRTAAAGDWEFVRAAEDVRRRIAEAMGYE